MGLWSRYIAWVDRDLDANLPSLRTASAAVPFVPLFLALPVLAWWDPPEATRHLIVAVAGTATAVLFGIWGWRIVAALIWQPPK